MARLPSFYSLNYSLRLLFVEANWTGLLPVCTLLSCRAMIARVFCLLNGEV
jgi:hypothetical protein